MCGIIGYLGKGVAQESLVDGLRRLEYRGYDSAGVAFHEGDQFSLSRETGRVNNLAEALRESSSTSSLGIAHTQWATHGEVTVSNTHPHLSYDKRFVLVHNGVIENFNTLKRFLMSKGIEFVSETDSEVLCNLIAYHYSELPEADDRFIEAEYSNSICSTALWKCQTDCINKTIVRFGQFRIMIRNKIT